MALLRVKQNILMLDVEDNAYDTYEADQDIFAQATYISFAEAGFNKMKAELGENTIQRLLNSKRKKVLITRGGKGAELHTSGWYDTEGCGEGEGLGYDRRRRYV